MLIDFWTYTCINCLRTLPYLEAWNAKYAADGLTIVGIETPEFAFEHDASNVASAISSLGIKYPVVQDNNMATWNAWGNQYWPAEFLIDATGQVRSAEFGEGDYAQTEAKIRSLLAAAGHASLGADAKAVGAITPSQETTPETYLGYARADGWIPANPKPGTHTTPARDRRPAAERVQLWRNVDDRPAGGHGRRGRADRRRGRGARTSTSCSARPGPGRPATSPSRSTAGPAADGVDVHNGSIAVNRSASTPSPPSPRTAATA